MYRIQSEYISYINHSPSEWVSLLRGILLESFTPFWPREGPPTETTLTVRFRPPRSCTRDEYIGTLPHHLVNNVFPINSFQIRRKKEARGMHFASRKKTKNNEELFSPSFFSGSNYFYLNSFFLNTLSNEISFLPPITLSDKKDTPIFLARRGIAWLGWPPTEIMENSFDARIPPSKEKDLPSH